MQALLGRSVLKHEEGHVFWTSSLHIM